MGQNKYQKGDYIYHKFYDRYGYIKGISFYCDFNISDEVRYNATICWKDDSSGKALPGYADLGEIELVDFKHYIRKANESNIHHCCGNKEKNGRV